MTRGSRCRLLPDLPLLFLLFLAAGCGRLEQRQGQSDLGTSRAPTTIAQPTSAVPSSVLEPSAPAATLSLTETPTPVRELQAGQLRKHQLPGGTAVEMVYVPAGTLPMGSNSDQSELAEALCDRYPDAYGKCDQDLFAVEQPQHLVAVKAFWIDRTEVTNGRHKL